MDYIKNLVKNIFGEEAANDKDIVALYKQIHKDITLAFAEWCGTNYHYHLKNNWSMKYTNK